MAELRKPLQLQGAKAPRLVFVTGGPGTGKGTQCAKLVEELGFRHVSIGDLVRAEIRAGSEVGRSIESITKAGNLVPKEIVVGLLAQTLTAATGHTLLVDGFPRDTQQAAYLEQLGVKVDYILHFEADSDEELLKRLVERGRTSGRADDTEEVITHRFRVYKAESLPVLRLFEPFGVIRKVSCMGSISEVFQRTVRRLRPEVLCVLGPINSGKSTIVSLIAQRHKYRAIDFEAIKDSYKGESDEELTKRLVKKLGCMKRDTRVVIDSFPQTLSQARYFSVLSGDPDRVLYVHCSKEMAQIRRLLANKGTNLQLSPAQVGTRYLDFTATSRPLLGYLKGKLGRTYLEGSSENEDSAYVMAGLVRLLEPEVVLVRGLLTDSFLQFLKEKRGYTLVNCCNLLRLWRFGRGLSAADSEDSLSDDPEVLDLLRNSLYSGAGGQKYALYNFSLNSLDNFHAFTSQIASIRRVFYLYRSLSPALLDLPAQEDRCTKDLYSVERQLEPICLTFTSKSLTLQDSDSLFFTKAMQAGESLPSARLIIVEGPSKAGKTTVAKHLVAQYGWKLLDANAVVEETKKRLSTEEEPKDSLTFTEFGEGLVGFLRENKAHTFVLDGLVPMDVLTLPGGKAFKDLENLEGGAEEEDPDIPVIARVKSLVSRWSQFSKSYLFESMDTLVRLHCPEAALVHRLKKASEIAEADELPAEARNDLFESQVLATQLAAAAPYFPEAMAETRTVQVNTLEKSGAEVQVLLSGRFALRLIVVKTELESTMELWRHLCWTKQAFFCTFAEAALYATEKNDQLGADMRRLQASGEPLGIKDKLRVLSAYIDQRKLPGVKVAVVCNYPFTLSPDYPRAIDELLEMEKCVGLIAALVTFTPELEKDEVFLQDLPVRTRKVKLAVVPEKAEDEGAEEEESRPTERPSILAVPEPESPVPVWNNNEATNLTMAFQYFKGQSAYCVCEELPVSSPFAYVAGLLAQLWTPGQRYNFQLYTSPAFDHSLNMDLNKLRASFGSAREFYEPLPVDMTGLGKSSLSRLFSNAAAREFHAKHLKLPTVPFSTFFAAFSDVLKQEGMEITAGLRRAIHASVDRNKNGCVTAAEVNDFFIAWESPSRRAAVQTLAQQKDAKSKQSDATYKLFLVVTSSSPDPLTAAQSFKRGDTFLITEEGCPNSLRFCADRCTLFGRDGCKYPNDISFHSADTRIRPSHFSVLSKKAGYYLADHGGLTGVQVRVTDFPMVRYT